MDYRRAATRYMYTYIYTAGADLVLFISVYLMLIGNLSDGISKLLAIASSNHINPLKRERKTVLLET